MLQTGTFDISKNPLILDTVDEITQIVDNRTKKVKGVFIPSEYLSLFDALIEEIEYKKFAKRNSTLTNEKYEDETVLDRLDNAFD